jgi:hypothetical protein
MNSKLKGNTEYGCWRVTERGARDVEESSAQLRNRHLKNEVSLFIQGHWLGFAEPAAPHRN